MFNTNTLEEVFCDAFGAALFGSGFLKAFRYLLAPSLGNSRDFEYPSLRSRAEFLKAHSRFEVWPQLDGFPLDFSDPKPNVTIQNAYVFNLSDKVAADFAGQVFEKAYAIVELHPKLMTNEDEARRILECFKFGTPPNNPLSLADIINAAWLFVDEEFVAFDTTDNSRIKFEWISEVAFKAIEIFEYNWRIENV